MPTPTPLPEAASREAERMFGRLVREGYEVRDLFFSDAVCVLRERPL